MKLFKLFNESQDELLSKIENCVTAKTSAVWIAEGVNAVGVLEKSDMIFVFFEGTLMCISERFIKSKEGHKNRAVKKILMSHANEYCDGIRSSFTEDKDFYELVAFKKGWYEWLDS